MHPNRLLILALLGLAGLLTAIVLSQLPVSQPTQPQPQPQPLPEPEAPKYDRVSNRETRVDFNYSGGNVSVQKVTIDGKTYVIFYQYKGGIFVIEDKRLP